jgi:hypothetical protein
MSSELRRPIRRRRHRKLTCRSVLPCLGTLLEAVLNRTKVVDDLKQVQSCPIGKGRRTSWLTTSKRLLITARRARDRDRRGPHSSRSLSRPTVAGQTSFRPVKSEGHQMSHPVASAIDFTVENGSKGIFLTKISASTRAKKKTNVECPGWELPPPMIAGTIIRFPKGATPCPCKCRSPQRQTSCRCHCTAYT